MMLKEKKEEIKYIRRGCIDAYYSIKIESKLNYLELCDCIRKKISYTINDYNSQVATKFKNDVEQSLSNADISELKDMQIEFTEKGFSVSKTLEVYEEIERLEEELKNDYDICLNIYGEAFVDNCQRIYLPPIKVQLINDEFVYVKAILYVFRNGMMVLRISIPIQNVEMTPLWENNIEGYIKGVVDELEVGIVTQEQYCIGDIKNTYLRYIKSSSKKIKSMAFTMYTLLNIILADFDDIPKTVKNLSKGLEEDLYRIIVASISKRNEGSFKDRAKEYLKNNSDIYDGVRYITNSMGKCVSIIDQTIIEDYRECESKNKEIVYEDIINNIRVNIEFAFIILLLKRINSGYTYIQKETNFNKVYEIQKEYLYNQIFIVQLQQTCYGSIKEQISFLEDRMKYFLDNKDTTEKMNAIDSIIEEERARQNVKFQNFLSVGGFLLAAVLGLPAIYETLEIFKRCLFGQIDIPIFTIENTSVVIWIILMLFISFKAFFRKR